MLKKTMLVMVSFVMIGLLASCSKVINTVNGLSTFQSTIAGSNYPFTVDKEGKLSPSYQSQDAENLIGIGDHFSINLDSLFLRYLQASDPYIVVYSEAWMGSKVRPTDDKLLQRQILLLKDGSGFNSRLPISWIPLFGPVTMEENSLDVYISLNVVVLSKNDNKQTTQLLDGLASVAGTVAPQYALIAGAAASVGKAIVAQNRDKVEFEHTFNLSPKTSLKQVFKANDVNNALEPPLAESKLVVIKGENEHRLVPYQNWFFYIWPFNWYGHKPSNNSLRFETSHIHYKCDLLNKSNLNLIDEGASYSLINLPFKILAELLIPNDSCLLQKATTSPDDLYVTGGYLLRRPANEQVNEQTNTQTNTQVNTQVNEKLNKFIHTLYSEKTHVILTIKKTDGSYGNFDQLKNKFSAHTELLNKLLSDNSSSDQAIKTAFDAIKKAAIYEIKRKKVVELAKTSVMGHNMLNHIISSEDEDEMALRKIFWRELSVQSGKRLKSALDNLINQNFEAGDFFSEFKKIVDREKAIYWKDCKKVIETERSIAWFNVLQAISDYLFNMEKTKLYSKEVTANFDDIKQLPDCS